MDQLEVAIDSTTKRNRALEEELSNLKKYFATVVPGAAPVRISRQELRPLTPADVASLRCVCVCDVGGEGEGRGEHVIFL
jgi:hypothetical protein